MLCCYYGGDDFIFSFHFTFVVFPFEFVNLSFEFAVCSAFCLVMDGGGRSRGEARRIGDREKRVLALMRIVTELERLAVIVTCVCDC